MDIRSPAAWLRTFWTLLFALAVAGVGLPALPAAAQTLTGSSGCSPVAGSPLNQCVGQDTWSAKPGDTLSGTLVFKGGIPSFASPSANLGGFSLDSPMVNASGIGYSWTIPSNATPGTYSASVSTDYDPSTGCGEGGWCPLGGSGGVTVVVAAAAQPPTAGNVSASTAYQTAVTFAPNLGGGSATRLDVGGSGQGTPGVSGMNLTFTPNPGFSGVASFAYSATGPGGRSSDATASVTVGNPPLPPAPTASGTHVNVPHNTKTDFGVSLGGNWTHMEVVSWPSSGGVVSSGSTFGYTPNNGYSGADSFTFRAVGPGGNSSAATVTLSVAAAPVSPAPGAGNVSVSTPYETAVSVGFAPSGDYWAIQGVSSPSNGSVSWPGGSGTTGTYTPNGGFSGTDSFTYQVTGPGGTSPVRTVTVSVGAPALPPAPGASNVSASTAYETAKAIGLSPSGDYSSLQIMSQPSNGSASVSGTTATYTPNGGFSGTDSFTYRARGPGGNSSAATVTVTVGAPALPPPPVAYDISVEIDRNNTTCIPYNISGNYTAIYFYGHTADETYVYPTSLASANCLGPIVTIPDRDVYSLPHYAYYRAVGPGGESNVARIVFVIRPRAPEADDVTADTKYETAVAIPLAPSRNYTSVSVVAAPSNGDVTINGDIANYTPNGGFSGTDTFSYRANGPGGSSPSRTVTVTVGAAPPALAIYGDNLTTAYETGLQHTIRTNGLGSAYTVSVSTAPTHGTASVALVGGTGEITYTPAPGFYGSDSLVVTATSLTGPKTATFNITVQVPPAPTASNATLTTAFQTAKPVILPVAGVLTTVSVVDQPEHGSTSITGTTLTYTPAAGYHGTDELTFVATGPGGSSSTRTLSITVDAPAAPTVANGAITTAFETPGAVTLTTTGYQPVLTVETDPAHGSVSVAGASVTYTPAAGYYGPDAFTVTATNGGGTSSPATVAVTVGLPAAPTLPASSLTTAYETAGSATLAPSGVYSSLEIVEQGDHGTASISGGVLTYTPAALYYGADVVKVRAIGPGGNSATANVSVTVGLPGAPSVASANLTTAYETAGSVTLAPSGVYSSLEIVDQGDHGTASISGNVLTYIPAATYHGADVVTVRAVGPGGPSAPAAVAMTVTVPAAPVAQANSLTTTYETAGTVTLTSMGVASSYAVLSQPAHGNVTVLGAMATYTPAAGHYGADAFTFTVSGPGGTSAPATVSVTVGNPPVPAASAASISTPFETVGTVNLAATGVYSTFQLDTDASNGTAKISGNVATYTPAPGYYGADAFTFTATGPGGASVPATVSVMVGLPGKPVASPDSIQTAYQTAAAITLRATGVYDTVDVVSPPTKGTLAVAGSVATYTPNAGYSGADAFTFTATGPGGSSNPATVAITVNLPAAPVVQGASLSTAYETAGTVDLSASGVYSTLEIVDQGAHGVASITGDRLTYTPAALYYGADVVTVRAIGPGGPSAPASVAITVGNPGAPVVQGASLSTAYETAGTVDLSASGVYSTLEIVDQGAHGVASITGDRLTFTPAAGYYGADMVTVRAVGPGGPSAPASVAITVGVPGAPVVQGASLTTAYETAGSVDLDASGVFTSLEIVDQGAHGVASITGDRLTYYPAATYHGADVVTVRAIGPGGASSPAMVSITVTPPEPAAGGDVSVVTDMDVPVSFDLAENAAYVQTALTVTLPQNGKVTITDTTATYTPDAGFFGQDSFTFQLTGAGGSTPIATATITVNGGPPPEAEPMEKEGPAGAPIIFDVTADLEGGPFRAIRMEQPQSDGFAAPSAANQGGRFVVDGLKIVFYPAAGWTGRASFGFAVENRFGWSAPSTVTAIITPIPETGPVIEVETWAGRPVDANVTGQATWGPFEAVEIVSVVPAEAITASVVRAGEGFALRLVPVGQFFGLVEIRYTLKNAYGVSNVGTVRLTVNERPDPSRDPEVTGLINAQTQAAYRFSGVQVGNVMRRLEAIHAKGARRNNVGLTLVPMNDLDPFADNPIMERQRAYMVEAGMIEHVGGSSGEARPGASGNAADNKVSWWVAGALDLGFKRQEGERGGFHFTTDGLTAGADFSASDKLILGAGLGFGRDNSRVGTNGTHTSSEALSGFVYGSWQPRGQMFVDGVLGAMSMNYDARRFVTATGQTIDSQREGRQIFGALSVGWEHRGQRLHWSPYGRVEFADIELGGFTEGDADPVFALAFDEQKSSRVAAALGVQGDYLFRYKAGDLSPTFRVEYRQEVKNGGTAGVRYADWEDSPNYKVELAPYDDKNLVVGGGVRWDGVNNFAISVDLEATAFNRTAQDARARVSIQWKF